MYLIRSTAEYEVGGRSRPGFPILLWDNMSSCWEANEFLRYYLTRGSVGSKKSWRPAGQALYDFFGFLQAHELAWDDVDRGEQKDLVGAYRDYCLETVKQERSTVRQRLVYVIAFYKFAARKGWISKIPFEYEQRRAPNSSAFLAHTDASGGVREVASPMPRARQKPIKYLTRDQAAALTAAAINPHHRMIIRLALGSGLRREELATFPASYVSNARGSRPPANNVRIVLDPGDGTGMKTKGDKPRAIFIPGKLMDELHHYLLHWRGERASLSDEERKPLFLTQAGLPWADDGKGMEAMVRTVGAKVGIATHPHMLRHTYATQTLVALQRHRRANRIEPVVFLQRQLGHASIATTMDYLHLVNELADDAQLAYDEELMALAAADDE
ncbi:tyrosine-type recombinase/integrase [Burkholderia contaminans]|uniref:Site-specific integrase n=1 Tax=Burkholderia contaminans TaxID=488447 RepID=A0AAP4RCK1_9BURK|nr:site-specific integrase [Burkholderia contaminans]MDN7569964.1 site-specific integrase [Burkholderia contaminans]